MTPKRPVNLNLFTIAFPVPAIVSILHRISGVILFLLIPVLLALLACSLHSSDGFKQVLSFFAHPLVKFFIWASLLALFYHLIAGVRHLLMDSHWGDSLKGGRLGAKLVLVVTIILMLILSGLWLW